MARRRAGESAEQAPLVVRLPRKRKPAAVGYLERVASPLPEDRQGLAVSTLGKVIRRGWDWIGLSSSSPGLVGGLIEAPGLSAALTLNKGDFVRAGRRGITYLGYRKALQEAVQAQLTAWGEARDREDSARRQAARPLERDLEAVLLDLAAEFPALSALVERRPGGQKRLPTGREPSLPESASAVGAANGPSPVGAESEPAPPEDAPEDPEEGPAATPDASEPGAGAASSGSPRPGAPAPTPVAAGNPPGARRLGRTATPDPLRSRDRLRAPARVARSRAAGRIHRPRQHRAPRLPARGRFPVGGLPCRALRGHGPRGGRGRARGHAGLPDDLPRAMGRGRRPRPAPPPAAGPGGHVARRAAGGAAECFFGSRSVTRSCGPPGSVGCACRRSRGASARRWPSPR